MRSPKTLKSLEQFGRVNLSPSFFMRDFLYSEISQIENIPNIPDFPDIAIQAGEQLCAQVLEPIQQRLGKVSIRSGFRCAAVNAKGAAKKYNCARNEANFAHHIWDHKDAQGNLGATACVVVNSFVGYYEKTGDWRALAWWIHDHIPGYSSICFFPKLAAFNIRWTTTPEKIIRSHIPPKGRLTEPGMANHAGNHAAAYQTFLSELS